MTKRTDFPPPMHPNEIDAAVAQMLNRGEFYIVAALGEPPISIYDWREREIERWQRVMKPQF